jgi:hypothetical protein
MNEQTKLPTDVSPAEAEPESDLTDEELTTISGAGIHFNEAKNANNGE